MKTNQLMDVAFDNGKVQVFHNTAMGDLTQLWSVGNASRAAEGKNPANRTLFLSSEKTKEFIRIVEEKTGEPCIRKVGRGKSARTYANLHLMIYAAEYLSAEFHFQVIDTFVKGKILELRNDSGDAFNIMNHDIDNHLPGREGKSNIGVFIQVAKLIKGKCGLGERTWNEATSYELRERIDIEGKLSFALRSGFVRDYDHLKEVIENI